MRKAQFSRDSAASGAWAGGWSETPWFYPESVAELLYYYGMIGTGLGAAQSALPRSYPRRRQPVAAHRSTRRRKKA